MMCAVAPLFPNYRWAMENAMSHEQDYVFRDSTDQTLESVLHHSPPDQPQLHLDHSASFTKNSGDHQTLVRKLNHNANERDRRRKLNCLYSTLRSLLPVSDQTKKFSIPATVSQVIKYIPELQQQIERLVKKKEELLLRLSRQGDHFTRQERKRDQRTVKGPVPAISASQLSDQEIAIQISALKVHKSSLSDILLNLEEDGLVLINTSSSESLGGRVFYALHLKWDRTYKLECEVLRDKLLSLCEKREAQLFQ